jgi:hypothetical protein
MLLVQADKKRHWKELTQLKEECQRMIGFQTQRLLDAESNFNGQFPVLRHQVPHHRDFQGGDISAAFPLQSLHTQGYMSPVGKPSASKAFSLEVPTNSERSRPLHLSTRGLTKIQNEF